MDVKMKFQALWRNLLQISEYLTNVHKTKGIKTCIIIAYMEQKVKKWSQLYTCYIFKQRFLLVSQCTNFHCAAPTSWYARVSPVPSTGVHLLFRHTWVSMWYRSSDNNDLLVTEKVNLYSQRHEFYAYIFIVIWIVMGWTYVTLMDNRSSWLQID